MISTRGRIRRTTVFLDAVPFTAVDIACRLSLRTTQVVGVIQNMISRGDIELHHKTKVGCRVTAYYVRRTHPVLSFVTDVKPLEVNTWHR